VTGIDEPHFAVSVVIPCFNARETLWRALVSVLGQDRRPREVIVVDDGSTDGGADSIAGRFDDVRIVPQTNQGVSAARNRGVEEARGPWIAFLDADDEWLPCKLKRQLDVLARHPGLLWCASGGRVETAGGTQGCGIPPRVAKHIPDRELLADYFEAARKGVFIHTGGIVCHKELLRLAGGFETGLSQAEDLGLWCRMAMESPAIGYVDQPCYVYHGGTPGSLSKRPGRGEATLRSLIGACRHARRHGRPPPKTFLRYAREIGFRALVRHAAGVDPIQPEVIHEFRRTVALKPLERTVLAHLGVVPRRWAPRIEGRLRDWHRWWHAHAAT
jgi:glycosyltransferase involved in cell wall biosynthesis